MKVNRERIKSNFKLLYYSKWSCHNPNWTYFRYSTKRYDHGKRRHFFFPNRCLVQNNASNLKARATVFDFHTEAEKLLLKIVSQSFLVDYLLEKLM